MNGDRLGNRCSRCTGGKYSASDCGGGLDSDTDDNRLDGSVSIWRSGHNVR